MTQQNLDAAIAEQETIGRRRRADRAMVQALIRIEGICRQLETETREFRELTRGRDDFCAYDPVLSRLNIMATFGRCLEAEVMKLVLASQLLPPGAPATKTKAAIYVRDETRATADVARARAKMRSEE